MSENYWEKQTKEEELDPISSFLSEWTDPDDEEDEFRSEFFQGLSGRRKKIGLHFNHNLERCRLTAFAVLGLLVSNCSDRIS